MPAVSRVFVTGANGFVGPHLARALAARGDTVHGSGLGEAPAGVPFARWTPLDVLEIEACTAALKDAKPDAIVHLAGQSSAARSFQDPEGTFRLNVVGTWNVLEAARRESPRARVLVIGSGESYGPQPEGTRVTEDAPFRPVSPYALSKAASDQLAATLATMHRLEVIRTRSFAHAGPGQAPTFALPSFAKQIAAIERGHEDPVVKVGNLEVVRDLTDVRDVADAYALLLERGTPGRAYNVGRGEGVRLAEVAARLCAHARVPVRIEVDAARFRPADVPYLVSDTARLRSDTGWEPRRPLEDTLEELLGAARADLAAGVAR